MKFEFNKRYATIGLYAFLVLACAALFWSFLSNLRYFRGILGTITQLLRPFIYGFGIAYILNPLLKWSERVLARISHHRLSDKPKRALGISLTYLIAAGFITLFIMMMSPLLDSINQLIGPLKTFLMTADQWIPELLKYLPADFDLPQTITSYIKQYANSIIDTATLVTTRIFPMLTSLASGLLNVVVGMIISIYMLLDKERFSAGIKRIWYAILPAPRADWVLELAGDANRVFGGFISGKILDSFIIGILCYIGVTLLRIPNGMLVSVIVGVTNVIPYFGPFIGAIPSFFIVLIQGIVLQEGVMKAFVLLFFILLLQQFDGNVLGPLILGDSTGLTAIWVIFSIMLFGGLYGFIGMFLGVPVFSVVFMLLSRLISATLTKRHMPVEIEAYCSPEAPLLRSKERPSHGKPSLFKKRKAYKAAHTVKPLTPAQLESQSQRESLKNDQSRALDADESEEQP